MTGNSVSTNSIISYYYTLSGRGIATKTRMAVLFLHPDHRTTSYKLEDLRTVVPLSQNALSGRKKDLAAFIATEAGLQNLVQRIR